MTRQDFERAMEEAVRRPRDGIGRMGEKSVHAVLKYAFEPYADNHEVSLGGYVADIAGENGIIEIQTRELWRLKPKLTAFLEYCPVTVVHPIVAAEWIVRIDPETGEISRRKSPRKRIPFDVLEELSPLRDILLNPGFRLSLVLLETERQDVGKAGSRKKQHLDRVPLDFLGEIRLERPADYFQLLPDIPPGELTAAELAKLVKRPVSSVRNALLTLRALGLAEISGKRGRMNLYQIHSREDLS